MKMLSIFVVEKGMPPWAAKIDSSMTAAIGRWSKAPLNASKTMFVSEDDLQYLNRFRSQNERENDQLNQF